VRVGVVLTGAVVLVLRRRRVRREFLQPDIVIVQQAVLGVVDVNAGGDVHGVHKAKPLLHSAFAYKFRDGFRDVEIISPMRRLEPELFREVFHGNQRFSSAGKSMPP